MHVPIDTTLIDHPRLRRFARLLGISYPTALGHLVCFWSWAMHYAEDGDLRDFESQDIAEAARWEGPPEDFHQALIAAEWINGESIHAWDKWGGKTKKSQEKANKRWREWDSRQRANGLDRYGHPLANGLQTWEKEKEKDNKKEKEKEKEKGAFADAPASSPVFEGKHFFVDEELHAKVLVEYQGIPSMDWLVRFYSRIDDYCRDNPKKYKRNAKGRVKSPSSILRNWLEQETFSGREDKTKSAADYCREQGIPID